MTRKPVMHVARDNDEVTLYLVNDIGTSMARLSLDEAELLMDNLWGVVSGYVGSKYGRVVEELNEMVEHDEI